jgi:hypothetical protein
MSHDALNFIKYFLFSLLTTLSLGTTALAATPDNQYESVEMVAYPIFMLPESSLAVDLQDQQVQAAAYLFDRDLNTAYSSIYPAQIVAPFGDLQTFNSLRIYGAAPFLLNIQAKQNDTWVPVKGLEGINLSAQPDQWNTFTATEAISTTELLLNIAPLVGSSSSGLREIEFWVQHPKDSTATPVAALPTSSDSPAQSDGSVKETHKVAKAATVAPGVVKKISHEEAELEVNGTAVEKETTVSVETLDTELPALDTGMINVTKGPRKGYRFGPHGMKFKSKIKVKLPYDKSLLPEGYTEQEIKTYYYDEELGHWQPLELESVDTQGQAVTSLTDHFTDMINSVVTTPEAPDTVSYNPNQIKDIKAADPGTGVTLIEPPQANNMGSAGLSYPLEVPPGRAGIWLQLALIYNLWHQLSTLKLFNLILKFKNLQFKLW